MAGWRRHPILYCQKQKARKTSEELACISVTEIQQQGETVLCKGMYKRLRKKEGEALQIGTGVTTVLLCNWGCKKLSQLLHFKGSP